MNQKLKCILLDDELPGLTYLKMLCEQIEGLEIVKSYNNPLLFLEDLEKLEFDLCILDIEMPGMKGIDVVRAIPNKLIIFTTAYKEFAADAFDLNALDYVRKPFTLERLKQAVNKAFLLSSTLVKPQENFLYLNTEKGKSKIEVEPICYIQTSDIDPRDKVVFLEDNQSFLLKNKSFNELMLLLDEKRFVRINKQEAIALKYVHSYTLDSVKTNILDPTGKKLEFHLSTSFRKGFLDKIQA